MSAQRCSVSVQRNNLCFSNVGFHLCQGSNAFKFPVPLLFLTSETLTANLLTANMRGGKEQKNRGQSVSKPFHTASFPLQRSFLPLPSDASKGDAMFGVFHYLCYGICKCELSRNNSMRWAGFQAGQGKHLKELGI